ncbi:hypothetical protein [Aureibaculum conchae]|uniref:hypothetical protein n=1 Tax=Aureibaculum sp. 2308TA14-22 TaxID=3108392 RepID=UPI00339838D4
MRTKFLITLLFITSFIEGQEMKFTYDNFDNEVLKYKPIQRENVSDEDYKNGLFKLNETKLSVKYNASNLNSGDFWNITMAFVNLKEPKSNIKIAFTKAISFSNNNVCLYVDKFGPSGLDKIITETFNNFYKGCKKERTKKTVLDLEAYSEKGNFNLDLIVLINYVKSNDQYYRQMKGKYYENPIQLKKQRKLDLKNQRIIDSLFNIHQTYIGRTLVGEEFTNVMWSVIQHSNVKMMEKYLPIVYEAYTKKEIEVVALKMLIDRFYGLKYGYQIFGSQNGFGFEMAEPRKRKEIIEKYKIH